MLAEAEEVESDLLGDVDSLEHVADGLGGGSTGWGVGEGVDAEFEGHERSLRGRKARGQGPG